MNNRLLQFLSAENLSQAQFADSIKVARAGVSHIIAGRNKPGFDFFVNTMKVYPDLNIEWLLTGKGKMFKTRSEQRQEYLGLPRGPQVEQTSQSTVENPETVFDLSETPREEPAIDVMAETGPNIEISEPQNGPFSPIQPIVKQRVATKIVVFYDDGTFQEF